MKEAKKKEILNVLERETLKIILKEDVTHVSNVLPGMFVLAITFTGDGQTKFKERYVVSGNIDR